MKLSVGDVAPGLELAPVTKSLTQETIQRYAEASGDFNPIHVDQSFAAQTPFGGTIAHGMLVMAYLSELLTAAFGRAWLEGGRLKVRFRAPARPGDLITARGRIEQVNQGGGQRRVFCAVECRNQEGGVLVSGDAQVDLEAETEVTP